jgi:hypothetical protein
MDHVTQGTSGGRLVNLARTLLTKGGTLESTAASGPIDHAKLSAAMEQHIRRSTRTFLEPDSATVRVAAEEVLENAQKAIRRVEGGGSPSNLSDVEYASLEAIVQVTGRPAMRYLDGSVEMPPSELGENGRWRVLVATARSKINGVSASVGRVARNGGSQIEIEGTAWRLGQDLVVTNRHVVQTLVENPSDAVPSWRINQSARPNIDFAATENPAKPHRFRVQELAYCAPEQSLDLAVLRLTPGDAQLPAPLKIDFDPHSAGRSTGPEYVPQFQGAQIYVVGHPYRALSSSLSASVFGVADGTKRWSPGLVVSVQKGNFSLEHDCSTLGGNSGSCVFTTRGHSVIGLHMGGIGVDETTSRGTANRALAFSLLGANRAADILRDGKV